MWTSDLMIVKQMCIKLIIYQQNKAREPYRRFPAHTMAQICMKRNFLHFILHFLMLMIEITQFVRWGCLHLIQFEVVITPCYSISSFSGWCKFGESMVYRFALEMCHFILAGHLVTVFHYIWPLTTSTSMSSWPLSDWGPIPSIVRGRVVSSGVRGSACNWCL